MADLLAQLLSPTGLALGAAGLVLGMIHDARHRRAGGKKP